MMQFRFFNFISVRRPVFEFILDSGSKKFIKAIPKLLSSITALTLDFVVSTRFSRTLENNFLVKYLHVSERSVITEPNVSSCV